MIKNPVSKLGQSYSRLQIHDGVGGELQSYLPEKHGKIVCGCFKMSGNPQAPREILPGDPPIVMRKARKLCEQSDPIPVFIKRKVNKWEYVGDFVAEDCSEDRTLLMKKNKESNRKNVSLVVYLKRV